MPRGASTPPAPMPALGVDVRQFGLDARVSSSSSMSWRPSLDDLHGFDHLGHVVQVRIAGAFLEAEVASRSRAASGCRYSAFRLKRARAPTA